LRDVLDRSALQVSFTDITLSHSPIRPGDLLFTRVVDCGGIQMGAGLFFAFGAVHRIHLLNAYQARMRTVEEADRSQRAYVFFYQKNRALGIPQQYQEIV
jgi:hypothetical protein